MAQDGNAIANYGLGQGEASKGPFSIKAKVGQVTGQVVALPAGIGGFVDATLVDTR